MTRSIYISLLVLAGLSVPCVGQVTSTDPVKVIHPILKKHCFKCHNDQNLKGSIDLKTFFFGVDSHESRIIKGGKIWMKVIKQLEEGTMPPKGERRLTMDERDTLIAGIKKVLFKSLHAQNPGRVVIRRLSQDEYRYTILALLGLDYDVASKFAADGSGGAGFDNFSATLFMTPLRMEQYYEASEDIVDSTYSNPELWRKLVPEPYVESWWTRFSHWVSALFTGKDYSEEPVRAAEKVIVPFASKAFRRFLKPDEKSDYLALFKKVYTESDDDNRYDLAIGQTLKAILVSPKFLYRYEEEQPIDTAYPLGSFELASRLSYFLWSCPPDQELYEAAYRGDLLDTVELKKQTLRMLGDPKLKRFSESFVTQWLGISQLPATSPVDASRFPEFTPSLRRSMYDETVDFFHYVLTGSKNFLDLINSDYTFLNEELAKHYGIEGVTGTEMRKVTLTDHTRGGVMGMGSVLVTTSLPLRTSPVKRGQFVLEEILGTPAPPPPPDAGQLSEKEAAAPNASIRELLVFHRNKPSCAGCHQKMDPIGFGMENFDPVGRWRNSYGGNKPIISWDTLSTGETFNGPLELREILSTKKNLFARVIAEKMFMYALGRNVEFTDELYIQELSKNLIDHNFNTDDFILGLVTSYPFRYAINDKLEKYKVVTKN